LEKRSFVHEGWQIRCSGVVIADDVSGEEGNDDACGFANDAIWRPYDAASSYSPMRPSYPQNFPSFTPLYSPSPFSNNSNSLLSPSYNPTSSTYASTSPSYFPLSENKSTANASTREGNFYSFSENDTMALTAVENLSLTAVEDVSLSEEELAAIKSRKRASARAARSAAIAAAQATSKWKKAPTIQPSPLSASASLFVPHALSKANDVSTHALQAQVPSPTHGVHNNINITNDNNNNVNSNINNDGGKSAPLPLAKHVPFVVGMIHQHALTSVSADTGSGKSTLLPPALVAAGCRVLITEPSVAMASSMYRFLKSKHPGLSMGYAYGGNHHNVSTAQLVIATAGSVWRMLMRTGEPHKLDFDVLFLDEGRWCRNARCVIPYRSVRALKPLISLYINHVATRTAHTVSKDYEALEAILKYMARIRKASTSATTMTTSTLALANVGSCTPSLDDAFGSLSVEDEADLLVNKSTIKAAWAAVSPPLGFKVVVCSATTDQQELGDKWLPLGNMQHFHVAVPHFPVTETWQKARKGVNLGKEKQLVQAMVQKVVEMNQTLPPGHILVFMPGLAMIDQMYHALYEESSLDNLYPYIAHGSLPEAEMQEAVQQELPRGPADFERSIILVS
jgi:hypothetical protein